MENMRKRSYILSNITEECEVVTEAKKQFLSHDYFTIKYIFFIEIPTSPITFYIYG